jgi:hypothetical protein
VRQKKLNLFSKLIRFKGSYSKKQSSNVIGLVAVRSKVLLGSFFTKFVSQTIEAPDAEGRSSLLSACLASRLRARHIIMMTIRIRGAGIQGTGN